MAIQFSGFRATRPVARVIDPEKQHYEVFFIIYDQQGRKRVNRFKRGINTLPRHKRKPEAEELAFAFFEALQKGWNPLVHRTPFFSEEHQGSLPAFNQALDYCLGVKAKTLARGSLYNYKSITSFLKQGATLSGYDRTRVNLIERKDIRLILEAAREKNDWTSRGRNQAMAILKSLLAVLVEEDKIKINPVVGIKKEKEPEAPGYKRLTDAEKETVSRTLAEQAPAYLEFLVFLYQTGIRPKELLLIKTSDINLLKREITVQREVSKTRKKRVVPITDDLAEILTARQISSLRPEWYLFSVKNFSPGPTKYWPTAGARWWRKYVIKGLGIDCKLYSLKHKGADDKILAGLPLDALRSLYGHANVQMTERYVSTLKERYKQQIIASAPTFAKVVQMKKAK
jgi:integrase